MSVMAFASAEREGEDEVKEGIRQAALLEKRAALITTKEAGRYQPLPFIGVSRFCLFRPLPACHFTD
jgi:hypothetical protein